MSGRWRSRYWTADKGDAQQQQQQQQQRWHHHPDPVNPGGIIRAAGEQDVRVDRNKLICGHNCGKHDGRSNNGAGYDNHNGINDNEERCNYYGRESSQQQFVSHQQRRQQPEPHHAKRAWRLDERSEWQRGQSLPQNLRGREPMESLGRNQGSRFIKRDSVPDARNSNSLDGNHSRSESSISRTHHTSTTNNSVLSDSITLKTQVLTKKPFAWNTPHSPLQQAAAAAAKLPSTSKQSVPSSTDADTSSSEAKFMQPFAWSKRDPAPSSTEAAKISSVSTSQLKTEAAFSALTADSNSFKAKVLTKKQTAWGVVTSDSNPTKILHAKDDKGPSISKQSNAPNSTSPLPPLNEHHEQTGSSFPSFTPLPSTSSWGKRHSNSAPMASDQKKLPIASEEKQMVTVEEYPSLSTVSTMSRRQQCSNDPLPPLHSTTDKPKSKNNPKKGALRASLASFLPNQDVVAPGPRISASKKKGIASTGVVGNKRSAPSSATMAPMEHGTGGFFSVEHMKKGRQRLQATSTPRKKKLTTLKKKVLKERLRVWKERNGIVDCDDIGNCAKEVALDDGENEAKSEQPCLKRLKTDGKPLIEAIFKEKPHKVKSTTLIVANFIRPEDNLVDEDEYDEIISDLIQLAGTVGEVVSVFVPRPQDVDEVTDGSRTSVTIDHIGLAFVRFATDNDASAANQILEGMVVGGQKICTSILDSMELEQFSIDSKSNFAAASSEENTLLWRLTVLRVVNVTQLSMNGSNYTPSNNKPTENIPVSSMTTIVIHKILSEDDYLDEEALHESIEDLKGLAAEYGLVVGTRWETMGENKGNVYITYAHRSSADKALKQLNGIIMGGSSLDIELAQEQHHSMAGEVILSNVLNDDDLDDEDCLSESLNDIRNLAEQYGNIGYIKAEVSGEQRGSVIISYVDGYQVAQHATHQLNGMVLGGRKLSASFSLNEIRMPDSLSLKEESKCDILPVMLSGGKRIPEQFAECKRVPKVPNSGTPRPYASKISDERVIPLLVEMLGELMRLQERSKDDKNARARRRLVMGLREVARGIRAHKVKMVIMANNLDEYGAIDSKLQEILDMATADELPILYELNKRKLGKALGKSIKVSVVGIQNADGAHDQFKKLKKMLGVA